MKFIKIGDGLGGTIINFDSIAWVSYDMGSASNVVPSTTSVTIYFNGQSPKTFEGATAEAVLKELEALVAAKG